MLFIVITFQLLSNVYQLVDVAKLVRHNLQKQTNGFEGQLAGKLQRNGL